MVSFEQLKEQIDDLRFNDPADCLSLGLLILSSYDQLIKIYARSRREDVPLLITTGREIQYLYRRLHTAMRESIKLQEEFNFVKLEVLSCLALLINLNGQMKAA